MGGRSHLIQVTGNDALTGFTAPKDTVGARKRARCLCENPPYSSPQGFCALPPDRCVSPSTARMAPARSCLTFAPAIGPRSAPGPGYPAGMAAQNLRRQRGDRSVITAQAAQETGLKAGTPVVGGGGDQAAGAVGVGAVEPGIISLALGTSGVVFATTDGPFIEPEGRLHAFLPLRPAALAPDGGDAVGCRQPALVPRYLRARQRLRHACWRRRPRSPSAAKACSSCRT